MDVTVKHQSRSIHELNNRKKFSAQKANFEVDLVSAKMCFLFHPLKVSLIDKYNISLPMAHFDSLVSKTQRPFVTSHLLKLRSF